MYKFKIVLLIWNMFVLFLYGADKLFAKRHTRRIREATLLFVGFLFGGVGAMFGMVLFNHKTSKIKFRILVPFAVVINVILLLFFMKNY